MRTRCRPEEWQGLPLWDAQAGKLDIWLAPHSVIFATRLGNWRQDNAIRLRLRNNNRLPRDEPKDRHKHIMGARSEMAAWNYLCPIHWYWKVYGPTELPDLGKLIEVKGTESWRLRLIVPPRNDGKDPPPERAYLLVSAIEHPCYRMIGWRWGYEFLDDAHWDEDLPRPAWVAPSPLYPPEEMLRLVREGKL